MKKYYKSIIKFNKNFLKCGTIGWLLEICWTGFLSFKKHEPKLTCQTSVWMFPIYGMASFFSPLSKSIKNRCLFVRGTIYTLFIFLVEFLSGSFLKKKNSCPWDYSDSKYNIKGLIRLDYAPLWFFSGLLFEKTLLKKDKQHFKNM